MSLTPSEYERAYLAAGDASGESGCHSGPEGWEIGRRPIVDAIHRPGTFLDVGCANGLLMESVAEWAEHAVEPYGLDFAPRLVELARRRLPQRSESVFLGDVMEWNPTRRFDFVRTELVYVEDDRRRDLVERLLSWVEPGGRLIVCGYGDPVCGEVRRWGHEPELELAWRSASGRVNELAAIGVRERDYKGSGLWPLRRMPSTPRSTSICPGRRRICRSGSGRGMSTGSTRISASSSRRWSRCCSRGTSRGAAGCSIRSRGRGRRSCRGSRAGMTRPASISPPSTAC